MAKNKECNIQNYTYECPIINTHDKLEEAHYFFHMMMNSSFELGRYSKIIAVIVLLTKPQSELIGTCYGQEEPLKCLYPLSITIN